MNRKEDNKTARSRLYTSVLLVLMAFVAVTAATVAWFSIADRAKVKTMSLDIIADADLNRSRQGSSRKKDFLWRRPRWNL